MIVPVLKWIVIYFSLLWSWNVIVFKVGKKISLFIGHLLNQVFILNRIFQVWSMPPSPSTSPLPRDVFMTINRKKGNAVCLGVRASKVPHKSHLIHYIPKSATLHSSKLVIILNLSSASLALFCSLMTASAFSFFILDISSCN